VAGKIAVIDRGVCGFALKVQNAQLNGAIGVIIANNAAGVIDMGNAVPPITGITIPSIMLSQADAGTVKANAPVTASIVVDPTLLVGADNAGRVRLYSPSTVAGGSTFSHFDTALNPNALMEPFDTPEIQSQFNVDLTPAAFQDIGWTLNPGAAKIGTCSTSIEAVEDGGIIIGANVAAQSAVCRVQALGNKSAYVKCMTIKAQELKGERLITTTQANKVFQCASFQ
jgi:hypothetical protein